MNISTIKITDAQNLLLQGLLSVLAGAGLAFVTASVQYISQHGVVSISTALSVGLAAFLYSFGVALKDYVPAHIQQELQALKDAQGQAQTVLASLQTSTAQPNAQTAVAPSQTISSPLVVINHPGSVPSSVEVAYQQSSLQGVLPQQHAQASVPSAVDDFPENALPSSLTAPMRDIASVKPVEVPAHLAMLSDISTQPQQTVPQQPFPNQAMTDDTLTGVQAARARQQLV